ncbi:aminopeptidase [Candidatus Bathyarchaeota archaeon]|nr:aminopeptidase [Candidatus Bathyarchaeota archaeon]
MSTSFARRVVKTCLRIGSNDRVAIFTWGHTIDLAEDLEIECRKAGAQTHTEVYTDKIFYETLKKCSVEYLRAPNPFELALADIATANIFIKGPENPEQLKQIPTEKWNALSKADKPFYNRLFERKIRSAEIGLGHVTPQRAKTYGFNFDTWKQNVHDALDVRYEEMQKLGERVRSILGKTKRVHLTSTNGSDLTLTLADRPINVYDGVVDEEDVKRGGVFVSLPSGTVEVAPMETGADGTFISNVPEPTTGLLAHSVRWVFERGKITSFSGGENIDAVKDSWEKGTGDKDRIGRFTLGLNPRAKTGFLQNQIVLGTVSIGIGENVNIGGKNESNWGFLTTLSEPTVELDGKPIIEKGRLVM